MQSIIWNSVLSFLVVAGFTSMVPMLRSRVDRPAAAIPSTTAHRDATLLGTLAVSFEDEFVVVQQNDTFFKIRRDKIATNEPTKLDQPGATVELRLAPGAIASAWTVDLGATRVVAATASSCTR